jgi:hypothetical protein
LKRLFRFSAAFGLVLAVAAQVQGGRPPVKAACSAWCVGGTTLTVNCSGTCTAVDVNCPQTNGYVVCNGVKTSCASACPSAPPPYCETLNLTSCSTRGATTACWGSDGVQYSCDCFSFSGNLRWRCPI